MTPTLTTDEMVTIARFASNKWNAVALTVHILRLKLEANAVTQGEG